MTAMAPAQPAARSRVRLARAAPVDPRSHTMSPPRLLRYLDIKVHHLIQERDWDSIIVVGEYDRSCVISANEKTGKLFNWQRPAAEPRDRTLIIKCFPGTDYVLHYALIIATYLHMTGRYRGQVRYQLPPEAACQAAVSDLNVDPRGDGLVILGWGLPRMAGAGAWTPGGGFAWTRDDLGGHRVLYLGFLHSIWGDVAGRVVARLAALGARNVVYIGKVGSLDPQVVPNTRLATGDSSILAGEPVRWRDFFTDQAARHYDVLPGVHATSPSILLEGRAWLSRQAGRHFVDPEIGHMGRAAAAAGIRFGFLHIISNNLACPYHHDLSNERVETVLELRAQLLSRIRDIIKLTLDASAPATGRLCR